MRQFTREERASAFDRLPPNIKAFLMSDESISQFQEIGKQFHLNIELVGILGNAITLVVLGMLAPSDFEEEIRNSLHVSSSDAAAISKVANEKVFLKIREGMQQSAPVSEVNLVPSSVQPTREDILAGIEDPTPAVYPISAAVPPTPPARPSDDHSQDQATAQTIQNAAAQEVAHDFIGGKLAEPVSLPTKKTTVDPYREPIA